jgi:hypothetical protein
MVILYIYSICWCIKSAFYERQQPAWGENEKDRAGPIAKFWPKAEEKNSKPFLFLRLFY